MANRIPIRRETKYQKNLAIHSAASSLILSYTRCNIPLKNVWTDGGNCIVKARNPQEINAAGVTGNDIVGLSFGWPRPSSKRVFHNSEVARSADREPKPAVPEAKADRA
jgi:hypothetical protein